MLKRFIRAMSILMVVLLASCNGGGSSNAGSTTVMVYMVGADLESDWGNASANLAEMVKAQLGPGVNVVIETGGADQTQRAGSLVQDWTTVQRYALQNGALKQVANLGAQSMGIPSTLTDFIVWAENQYPSAHYKLLLWDHGAGWRGYGSDENTSDILSLQDITTALEGAKEATKVHLDLIGFDACLMSTVEVADALAPYADYLLASQEVEPGTGWDWSAVIASAGADSVTFGKNVIDTYIVKQTEEGKANAMLATLALTDLSKIAAVSSSIAGLGQALEGVVSQQGGWTKIAYARSQSPEYAMMSAGNYDLTDVTTFSNLLAGQGIASQAAASVANAANNAVVYVKNGAYTDANGLSMFFPSRSFQNLQTLNAYQKLAFSPAYRGFAADYVSAIADKPYELAINVTQWTSALLNATITSDVGLASVDQVLMLPGGGDDVTLVGSINEPLSGLHTSTLNGPPAGNWVTLNGSPLLLGVETALGPEYKDYYGAPIEVDGVAQYLIVYIKGEQLQLVGTVKVESEVAARLEPLPAPDSDVRVLGAVFDTHAGEVTSLVPVSGVINAASMTVAVTPIGAGYQQGILATDLAGNAKLVVQ